MDSAIGHDVRNVRARACIRMLAPAPCVRASRGAIAAHAGVAAVAAALRARSTQTDACNDTLQMTLCRLQGRSRERKRESNRLSQCHG